MKKGFVFALFFFWGSLSSLNAQVHPGWDSMHGVENFIVEYGDQLNLTDEQKAELLAKGIERRSDIQRRRVRGTRSRRAILRGEAPRHRRPQTEQTVEQEENENIHERGEGERRSRDRSRDRTAIIYDVLTDDQIATLQSLKTERAEKQHELRILRNRILVGEHTEIEGDKTEEVISILNRMSEQQKAMQIRRIQNPDDRDREAMRESRQQVHEAQNDLKNLLTAAEYEAVQRAIRPGLRHLRPGGGFAGRSMMRMRGH